MGAKQDRSLIPRGILLTRETAPANQPTATRYRPSLPLPLAPGSLWQLCYSFIFVYFSYRGFCNISPEWDSYINKFHCITNVMKSRVSGLLAGASGPVHKALYHTPLPLDSLGPYALAGPVPLLQPLIPFCPRTPPPACLVCTSIPQSADHRSYPSPARGFLSRHFLHLEYPPIISACQILPDTHKESTAVISG